MNPITLPVQELKPALAGLSKIIARKSTLPVLGCIRIERTNTGRIKLAATDLDTSAIVQLDTTTQGEPVKLLIGYDDLNNIAKGCGRDDSLILAPVDKNKVAIRFPVGGQMIEHRCESIPVDEYPDINEIKGEPIALDTGIRQSLHDAMTCASTDPTRFVLNGAFLDVSGKEGHYVVATDGHHLFSSNSFKLPLKESLIIPTHRFLRWKEFNQDGDWQLRSAKTDKAMQFEIATNHWRFISRSVDGQYPKWKSVIPDMAEAKITIVVEAGAVEAILLTIARMPDSDSVNHAISLEVAGKEVALVAKSPNSATRNRVPLVGVKATGADVLVHLNRHFLSKALRFGLTRIEIIDAITPLRFSNGGRQMIVMPVRAEAKATVKPEPSTPPPVPVEQPERKPMPETNSNGASRSTTTEPVEKPALETALAQIEVIRGEFRNAVTGLTKLSELLKQASREQKTSEKDLQGVRQTLRSLQNVRI